MSKKWTYELNTISNTWTGGICDSREEAIREATNEASIDGVKKFKIGICENVFNYGIDADEVLERIAEETYKDVGFEVVDYLCYALPEDEEGDSWYSYHLKIVGDDAARLKKIY